LWFITILIVVYSYYDYIKDMFKWTTKPHVLSWTVFVIIDIIVILTQRYGWAGPGVWATDAVTIWAIMVLILSFKYWEKDIRKSDIVAFTLSLFAVILYVTLSDPTYAMICVIIILALAFYPTFRKTYHKPNEETLSMYILAWVRSCIAIFATVEFSFLTLAFPVYVIMLNIVFVSMVLYRKKKLWIK